MRPPLGPDAALAEPEPAAINTVAIAITATATTATATTVAFATAFVVSVRLNGNAFLRGLLPPRLLCLLFRPRRLLLGSSRPMGERAGGDEGGVRKCGGLL